MRYDDPARPVHEGAERIALQVNRSPLPCFTLIRPVECDAHEGWQCTCAEGCIENASSRCPTCKQLTRPCWGWLVGMHAENEPAKFGFYHAIVPDLARFTEEYIEDPEATLARYFRYHGPAPRKPIPRVVADSLFD